MTLKTSVENASEMVSEVSEASKDQQSESATSENYRFGNLPERDLEKKYWKINDQTRPRETLTGVFLRSRVSFKLSCRGERNGQLNILPPYFFTHFLPPP